MPFNHWVCQKCGYIITDEEVQLSKHDYGCARCGNSYANFTVKLKEQEENNETN